jgi:hypothetical protein
VGVHRWVGLELELSLLCGCVRWLGLAWLGLLEWLAFDRWEVDLSWFSLDIVANREEQAAGGENLFGSIGT